MGGWRHRFTFPTLPQLCAPKPSPRSAAISSSVAASAPPAPPAPEAACISHATRFRSTHDKPGVSGSRGIGAAASGLASAATGVQPRTTGPRRETDPHATNSPAIIQLPATYPPRSWPCGGRMPVLRMATAIAAHPKQQQACAPTGPDHSRYPAIRRFTHYEISFTINFSAGDSKRCVRRARFNSRWTH